MLKCTQFGTSAKALSKRPSSFDLRRGNPRAGKGLSHACSSGVRSTLQAGCEEADWRNAGGVGIGAICGRSANSCSGTGGAGGAAAAHILGYQSTSACVGGGGGSSSSTFASGVSRPCRNSLRPGGYLVPAYGACTASPTAAEPSCAPAGGGGGSGSSNVAGGGGSAMLGRKLGLGLPHRRFRAAQAAGLVAVHSARHAAAGLWLSTEDMIAALTLSDRQMPQQQQVSAPRAPAWPSGAQPGGGGSGFGPGHNASTGGTCRPQQQLTAVPPPPPPPATTTSVRGNDGGGSPSRIARPSCVEAGSRQRLQHEQQWLCGSAPAASLSFGV
ncbi:hypothetical protein VOLCADRAFT_96091 [Volvox carteri f. nagariensis]|uniref:Uncharacterized protein n=1 Tax=Volvox carteri f. nagariensis TaxID=3068 RepID=D8U967_VOLCA|nr:uncharacterized protein VOLCADRAFT_96091 [Volvox carteri f. nagariensis]EFJ43756.1 hypothetical protein VOLCADRAFT_96091 [Volvox carteri f. nagariensis]|eukprot:XP_002955237.1 hypothetical protein VOLCADRAFT_96091 [Volvox carteri f. nagariensis]